MVERGLEHMTSNSPIWLALAAENFDYTLRYGSGGLPGDVLSAQDQDVDGNLVEMVEMREALGDLTVCIHVCVCVCVGVYIYIYTYMHTYIHTCMHVPTYNTYTYIHTYIHIHRQTILQKHGTDVSKWNRVTGLWSASYAYIHTHTHMHACTNIQYIHIHTYIHIYNIHQQTILQNHGTDVSKWNRVTGLWSASCAERMRRGLGSMVDRYVYVCMYVCIESIHKSCGQRHVLKG
jgi:hypothetical protein